MRGNDTTRSAHESKDTNPAGEHQSSDEGGDTSKGPMFVREASARTRMDSAAKTWRNRLVKEVVPPAIDRADRRDPEPSAGNAPIAGRFALEAVNKGIGASQASAADESQISEGVQCDVGSDGEKISRTN